MSGSPWMVWIEVVVGALLVLSGVFVVISAVGFMRLPDFFLRMHPPALAYTFGSWCVTLAGILYFSALASKPVLHPWLIIILLSITVPVSTLLLARAALFRRRAAGTPDTPAPLSAPADGRGGPGPAVQPAAAATSRDDDDA